jgi:hypothetical protein
MATAEKPPALRRFFVFSDPPNDDLPDLRRARKFRPEKMADLTEKYIRRKIPTNIAGVSSGA